MSQDLSAAHAPHARRGAVQRGRSSASALPFDPVAEATRRWREHGWADAADGMAAVTSLMRAQAIVQGLVDDVLRPMQLSFARYELLMLLTFTRRGALPMAKAGARLQVHPASVTNAASRLEAAGYVVRRPSLLDGRAVLVEITDAGRSVAAEATERLNREVFGRPDMTSPRMVALVDILRDVRREAGDFEQ